ncbi:hypothetical protein [Neoroseomonas oryzicola]|uniref:Uncharacterized protein n=1 Tax=Neoroseomonas oryzicola TaxID=535904 RepID=A0A9X9WLU3_9PROT|nr:hypothetical protein [Neoroseomonas oryzicola]MBR0661303.1 hypothetical protein [Neoroseomonas oryzicola]NKE19141.1 hypothetical protein [Neoroseomonas oryzicola]
MRSLKALLRPPLLLLAFLWVVLEETLWSWSKALGGLIARIPVFALLERLILRLDARLVLLIFAIPIALLFPVKIAALWLITNGQPLGGLLVLLAAKTIGTAFSARLYVVAEPKLMTIPIFAKVRNWLVALLARAHAFLDSSPSWQAVRRAVKAAKAAIHAAARRVRLAVLGGAPSLLERVRSVRRTWRGPA